MSVIEDSRKVLQDFLAPELRAVTVRLDALEKRFDRLEDRMDKRFDAADKRFDEVMTGIRQIIDFTSINERLARLESKESTSH